MLKVHHISVLWFKFSHQDDDISTCVQHFNIFHTEFEIRIEDALTMEIPQMIIDPFGSSAVFYLHIQFFAENTELSSNINFICQ